jgi:hypothetical protein
MKARAWVVREQQSDLEDLRFLLGRMEDVGIGFGGLVLRGGEGGDEEALMAAGDELGSPYQSIFCKMLRS